MTDAPRYNFTLARRSDTSDIARNRGTDGIEYAFLFSSSEKAQAFLDFKQAGDEWFIKHLADDRLVGELAADLFRRGVEFAMGDPEPTAEPVTRRMIHTKALAILLGVPPSALG